MAYNLGYSEDIEAVIKRKGPQVAHKVAVSEAAEIAQPKARKAKAKNGPSTRARVKSEPVEVDAAAASTDRMVIPRGSSPCGIFRS